MSSGPGPRFAPQLCLVLEGQLGQVFPSVGLSFSGDR